MRDGRVEFVIKSASVNERSLKVKKLKYWLEELVVQ